MMQKNTPSHSLVVSIKKLKSTRSSKSKQKSLLRSIRLCHEASLLLRTAGWSKGDLQHKLLEVIKDQLLLSRVDVDKARLLGDRERHQTRTTSARIDHLDYERLFKIATLHRVSLWAFLNQAIIQKYGQILPN